MVYNHVARASAPSFNGYTNSFPTIVNSGEQHTINFAFALPAGWDENEIHIIGLLIDPTGKIDNAGKATITEAVSNGYVTGSNAGLYDTNENELDESVRIYPNPACSQTNIALNLKTASDVEIMILDLSGKIMTYRNYALLIGNTNIPLNTTSYSAGVYIVETTINGKKIQKKFIVE